MKCRLCNEEHCELFYSQGNKNQFKYYRCPHCGLVNLDLSTLSISESQKKYEKVDLVSIDYEKIKGPRQSYSFISKHVKTRGTLLDIGCGNGSLLYFARKDGWQIHGLDLSPVLAELVQKNLDIKVEVANFLEYENTIVQYDAVCLRHVLEHLPDSDLALSKISALLKKGGYLYMEFPNINGFPHRLQRFRNKFPFLRKHYSADYEPAHCNEFSRKPFEYLLNKNGNFRLIEWTTYSSNSFSSFIYNYWHIGTKVRALMQKIN